MILLDLALLLLAFWGTGSTGNMLIASLRSGVLPGQRGAGDLAERAQDPRRFRRYLVFYLLGFSASLFFLGHQLIQVWEHVQR